jgi:peptidoglycan hydrolase CwlO-like protein
MRDSELQTTVPDTFRETPPRKRKRGAFIFYAILWIFLVTAGVAGAKMYSDHIQQKVSADLKQQTASQIIVMQQQFDSRITKLEASYTEQLTQMQGKIDALNELLTFTKDNADSKTDNSNKLYTQLAEVKKQLNELKKSLDVLK